MAIASLVLSFFSLLFVPAILAIVFGHVSCSKIKKSAGRLKGRGLAIAGLVIGYLGVAAVAFLLIIAGIFIPIGLADRMAGNQGSAVSSLRTINTVSVTYRAQFNHGFPKTLTAMGPSPGNIKPSEQSASLIDSSLASGTKSGYKFTYTAMAIDNKGYPQAFTVQADPLKEGITGRTHFCTDESGVVRWERGKPANKDSPALSQ